MSEASVAAIEGEAPRDRYARLEARHGASHTDAKARSFRFGTVRVVTFLAGFAAFVTWDVTDGGFARAALVAGVVLTAAFIGEIAVHRRVRREERWHGTMHGLAEEGLARVDRAWGDLDQLLPERERRELPMPAGHFFAHDLGLQGRTSLRRLLGPVTTTPGRQTVVDWLASPAPPSEASARAEAVRELQDRLDDRMTLSAFGRQARDSDAEAVDRFFAWASGDPWTLQGPWLRMAAITLPLALIAAVVADVAFGAPPYWLLPVFPQVWLLRRVTARLAEDFRGVGALGPALDAYVPQLQHVAGWSVGAPHLSAVLARLEREGKPASALLRRLGPLVDMVESRGNMVYGALAPILLLDIHIAVRLDRWREANGPHVSEWIAALGEVEALCALATLAHDNPDWCFPTWTEGPPVVEAQALGHPLLPEDGCVHNDVSVGPPGTFLLVTGSNMSGKSTLLRSIGTNVVLAGAGAPVCAAAFSLSPVRVCTSMSIEDSLADGISLFMAQLLRVRDIVEVSREEPGEAGPVLFLLDEILHGTNSAERRIAAQAVLTHLTDRGAIGAVSTHDLALADTPALAVLAHSVHFRETVHRGGGKPRLDFDYLMRPGPAQTSNALALLEAVGLELPGGAVEPYRPPATDAR
jgi:hypothetical protein